MSDPIAYTFPTTGWPLLRCRHGRVELILLDHGFDASGQASAPLLRRLYIIEERHETVVHVQLLVAVEKREPWIISNEVHLGFLVSTQHHNIFQDSSCPLPGQARQLKTMAMEMDWVDIDTGIAHTNAIE